MNVFLSDSDASAILARYPRYIASLHGRVRKALNTNFGSTSPTFHRYALMPPCGFPYLHASRILPGEIYRPDVQGPAIGRRIVAMLRGEKHASTIHIGSNSLSIRLREAGLYVTHDSGNTITVPDFENCLDISMLPRDGIWEIFVNKRHFLSTKESFASPDAEIIVKQGALALIQWQHRSFSDTQLIQFGPNNISSILKDSTETYDLQKLGYRKEWEQLGNRIYTTLIAAASLSDITKYLEANSKKYSGLSVKPDKLRDTCDEIRTFSQYFVDAFCSWPYWRPCMSDRFDGGDWDIHNWSNGTIPGALAIAAILAGQQDDPVVLENFLNKGAAWVRSSQSKQTAGIKRFRNAKHWSQFSTNHGLVIYYSYFTGARLLKVWSKEDTANQRELAKTLAISLSDGGYLEGLGYLRFALGHGVPHYFLRIKEHPNKSWNVLEEKEQTALAYTWRFVNQATSAPNVPFANFGDNQPEQWNEVSFARMLAKISGAHTNQLEATIGSVDTHTDAFSALALTLPTTSNKSPEVSASHGIPNVEIFERAGLVLAHSQAKELSLFFNLSRPHKTHNKNNDLGGLVVASKNRILLRAKRNRSMHFNNAVCGVSNGQPIPYEEPRHYGGKLHTGLGSNGYIASGEIVYPIPVQDGTGLYAFRRGIFLFENSEPILCIASAVQTFLRDGAAFCFSINQSALSESGFHLQCFNLDGTMIEASSHDSVSLFIPPAILVPEFGLTGPKYMQAIVTIFSRQSALLEQAKNLAEGCFLLKTPDSSIPLDMSSIFRRVPVREKTRN